MATTFVGILSKHNLPELTDVMLSQPETVIAIVSDEMAIQFGRFSSALSMVTTGVSLVRFPQDTSIEFRGDTFVETQSILQTHLRPLLEERRRCGDRLVLNATGGTKALSSCAIDLIEWDELHYLPMAASKSPLIERFCRGEHGRWQALDAGRLPTGAVSPVAHATLYNLSVKVREPGDTTRHPASLATADQLLAWQSHPFGDGAWWLLSDFLADQRFATTSGPANILIPPSLSGKPEIVAILRTLADVCPVPFQDDATGITIPGPGNKAAKDWCKWVSGMWFEQWTYEHLLQIRPDYRDQLVQGLAVSNENDKTGAEADLFLSMPNAANLVELKVDIDLRTKKANEIIDALQSRIEWGEVTRHLLVCPGFDRRVNAQTTARRFIERLHQSKIKYRSIATLDDLRTHFSS